MPEIPQKNSPLIGGLYFGIWRNVAQFCNTVDLCNLGFTNATLHEVCDFPPIWNNLLKLKNLIALLDTLVPNIINSNNKPPAWAKFGEEIISLEKIRELCPSRRKKCGNEEDENDQESTDETPLRISHFPQQLTWIAETIAKWEASSADENVSAGGDARRIFRATAARYFPMCRSQLCVLLHLFAFRLMEHHYTSTFEGLPMNGDIDLWSVVRGSRSSLREVMPFRHVLSGEEYGSGVSAEREKLWRMIRHLDKDIGFALPVNVACLQLRQATLSQAEYLIALNEVFTGVTLDYYLYSYLQSLLVLAPIALIARFFIMPYLDPYFSVRLAEVKESAAFGFELFIFLVPHLLLVFIGGGYFGVFFSMKRIDSSWKKIQLLFFNNFFRVIIHALVEEATAILLTLLWSIPTVIASTFLTIAAVSPFVLSSASGKTFVNSILYLPLTYCFKMLFTFDPSTGSRISQEIGSNAVRAASTVVVGIFSSKAVRVAVGILLGTFLLILNLPKPHNFVANTLESLGSFCFAIPLRQRKEIDGFIYFEQTHSIRDTAPFALLRCWCSCVFCFALIFAQDGRNSTFQAKSSEMPLLRQLITMMCIIVSRRFETFSASPLSFFQNSDFWSSFSIFNILVRMAVGLTSDFFRCSVWKNQYEHDVFKSSPALSGKLKFESGAGNKEKPIFFEQMGY